MKRETSTYDVRFKGTVETQFNNTTQATGQLVEVTERPNTKVTFPANLPDNVAGYFTVGDIHARLLRVYGGDPWQSYGQDARTSRDVAIKQNINRIRAGQVVVISAGYNDAVTTTDTPEAIGKRVADIVNTSVRLGHVVTFMLYRITQKGETARQEAIRASIVSELSSFTNIRIIDLNAAQYSFGVGGIALNRESYISISDSLI